MLLIVGLDGATLDLAGPWMDSGKLPVLAALREGAKWGTLRSTIPPATLPSWTTFMTGVNPGEHGVFDFTRLDPGRYSVRFVNSTFRKRPSAWRLLSEAGRRVCVLGMPGTYPPEPINGYMISGFDAPVTTRANRSFIHPPELADEVMAMGGFSFADFQEFCVGPGWYRMALSRLLSGIEAKTKLAQELLRREKWDCFTLVYGESDTVSHHFWHFHDRSSPRHDARGALQFGDAIELVYRELDAALGRLLASAPPGTRVLIASDHGFGAAGNKAVHLNRWLFEHGWLSFGGAGSKARLLPRAKRAALRFVPPHWQAPLFRSFNGRLASRLESKARFAGIDWHQTQAFSEELNYFPSIWINREGRYPAGQVSDEQYEGLCRDIARALEQWTDPETGRRMVRRVRLKREAYSGRWLEHAPDLVLELEEDCGHSYTCLTSGGQPGAAVRRQSAAELVGGKRFGMSGSHRSNGMFLVRAVDDAVDCGYATAEMVDMAPTILTLCAVEPPAWMEGHSLAGSSGAAARAAEETASEETFYADEDEELLEDRLRALGYIA